VLKKARFSVILVVAAALVLSAVFSFSLHEGTAQVESSIGGETGRAMEDALLPNLSESASQRSLNPAPSQTDNSTVPVPSGGAVKASFTVVARPVSVQLESGISSTGNAAREPNGTYATAPAQEVNSAAVDGQPAQNNQVSTATGVRPRSGGFSVGWVLLIAAWSLEIAVVCGLAFLRVRARE